MDKIKIAANIEWAFLNKINEMSGKYQIDLCNLSPQAVKALAAMGINALNRDDKADKGYYITCKSVRPIMAYDETGTIIPEDVLVGNGSKATCVVGYYEWRFKNKKGKSPSLIKLIITDLKTYDDGGDTVEIDGDGFNDSLDDIL